MSTTDVAASVTGQKLRIRHIASTSGRLPVAPESEPASGVVAAALGLTRHLAGAGRDVQPWGWNDQAPTRRRTWQGVRLWSSPVWSWARVAGRDLTWLAPVAARTMTQRRVDILHVHVDMTLLYLPGARRRVLHVHTPVPDVLPAAHRRVLARAHGVVCCSELVRRRFVAASDYPADRTFVVHNGTELSAYASADRQAQRHAWGLSDADVAILYTGAIVPEKGVLPLVRAFGRLRARGHRVTLVVVGGSGLWSQPGGYPSGDAYEAEVRRVGEPLGVRFVGILPRQEMASAYVAADIATAPSVWEEPFGMVVCEAMAAGRPVVASRAGGIPEMIDDGVNGLLVPPGDEVALSNALELLVTDEERRAAMGRAAHERSAAFSWQASARRLNAIYQELMDHGPR